MSLFWKIAVVLAVLAVADASKRSHHLGIALPIEDIPDTKYDDIEPVEGFQETMYSGLIHCDGEPALGVRPFLQSPWYNNQIEVITTTQSLGFYRMMTTPVFQYHKSVYLTVRHRCRQQDIPLEDKCAIPIYWTEIPLPLDTGRLSIEYNFDLAKMQKYTRADCLY